MKKQRFIGGFVTFVILFAITFFIWYRNISHSNSPHASVPYVQQQAQNVSYFGKNGQDALTLLQHHATITLDHTGIVATINGYTAQSLRHEYWAFYVNGKLAPVGPKDYVTKDTDKIDWKIEKY